MSSTRGLPIGPPPRDLPLQSMSSDGPFFRPPRLSRAKREKRSGLRRAAIFIQVGAAVCAALVGAYLLTERFAIPNRFRIASIEVKGNKFLSEGEVREMLGPAMGGNLMGADLEALRANLAASPWVGGAIVRRKLPDTLLVDVTERFPIALAETDQLYVMDSSGELIDLLGPRTAGFDLPIIRGLGGVSVEVRRDRARRASTLLEDLGDLSSEVSEISVDRSGDLMVVLRGDGSVLKLAEPPYRKRVLSFLALRQKLKERCPDAEYFDLRFKDRIYAKPASRDEKSDVSPEILN
ncbi:MAG TPA: FtsQ-type POTRA domain-containing protein [Vicinamibacteria bacterium]|nr:FtsQ-type POTRA domain-containing protein [Vicinamibacteria bacterium]HRB14007.1 FtsQ-type POTRA domain-containing protein [Vicinamibacteria bacterium]